MLEVSSVSLSLGGHSVLEDVSLRVDRGELLALVGPNGAGKSTLLSIMAGDADPDRGSVLLDGIPLSQWKVLPLSRRRSVMLQEQGLAFGFRAVDVVRMGRAPWANTPDEDEDEDAITDAMERAEVLRLAHRTYPSLSGGEKARTSFAKVHAQRAGIVFLDEPTAALDLRHQERVLAEAQRLAHSGKAVVAVLHDLSLAAAYADRICLVHDGRLEADGAPRSVLTSERLSRVYRHPVELLDHDGTLIVLPRRGISPDAPDSQEESCVAFP